MRMPTLDNFILPIPDIDLVDVESKNEHGGVYTHYKFVVSVKVETQSVIEWLARKEEKSEKDYLIFGRKDGSNVSAVTLIRKIETKERLMQ